MKKQKGANKYCILQKLKLNGDLPKYTVKLKLNRIDAKIKILHKLASI